MIKINKITKKWPDHPDQKALFNDFSLNIKKGDFVGLFGSNGVGKTTLFNIIANLDKEYCGEIKISGNENIKMPDIGYVFQNYRQSLFPWRRVWQNIAYPLKLRGKSETEQKSEVKALCQEYEISIDLDKYPYELSGGQQQIIAVLRALIHNPKILFLDEPFSAIDHDSTILLMRIIQEVWIKNKITILYISHDIDEALIMCNRVVVLNNNPVAVSLDCQNDMPYPRSTSNILTEKSFAMKGSILKAF